MLFCLPALSSSHDKSITLSGGGIKASHKTLQPQTLWNVWFLALSAWSRAPSPKHSDSGPDPNGCPEFSAVTLSARNNGRRMLESFTSLMLTLHFFSNGFPKSKWDNDSLCRANSTSNSHQGTMWDSFWGRRIVWSLEMWCKAARAGETEKRLKMLTSIQERVLWQVCIVWISDLHGGKWWVLIFYCRCEGCRARGSQLFWSGVPDIKLTLILNCQYLGYLVEFVIIPLRVAGHFNHWSITVAFTYIYIIL